MIRYIFASKREADKFKKFVESEKLPSGTIEVLGKEDERGDETDVLIHVGYCSGDKIPVNTLIEPSCVIHSKTMEMIRVNSIFPLEDRVCFSSPTFAIDSMANVPAIYDRALFEIAERPHKYLYAIKIVTDNMDEEAQKRFNRDEPWIRAINLLKNNLEGAA